MKEMIQNIRYVLVDKKDKVEYRPDELFNCYWEEANVLYVLFKSDSRIRNGIIYFNGDEKVSSYVTQCNDGFSEITFYQNYDGEFELALEFLLELKEWVEAPRKPTKL